MIIESQEDIHNANFLLNENEETIDLVTPQMYSSTSCNVFKLDTINRFSKRTMQWENSSFYPQMYKNLHGCTLLVKGPSQWLDQLSFKVVEALTRFLNYRMKDNENQRTDTRIKYELFSNIMRLDFGRKRASVPFFSDQNFFFIPPGDRYTAFEKMFMMFELEVWIAIAVTLLIAFAVIQVINLFSYKIQDFVYGTNNRTPSLNVQSIFLTGNQFKIPGRNFARFLLMLYIIWSLIIRTCYQSKLFEYLQAGLKKPKVTTIKKMIERNFTFYGDKLPLYEDHEEKSVRKMLLELRLQNLFLLPAYNLRMTYQFLCYLLLSQEAKKQNSLRDICCLSYSANFGVDFLRLRF